MKFSIEIKLARKNKGLSQARLANLLSIKGQTVTAQQVSCWEKGRYEPNKKNLINIYEILGMSLNESPLRRDSESKLEPSEKGGGNMGLQSYIREHGTKEEILELDFAESDYQLKQRQIADAIRARLRSGKKASA